MTTLENLTPFSPNKFVAELFETTVSENPNAIAIVAEDKILTYQQLNTQTNKLASYLKTLGVGQNTIVGIFAERSIEMAVAILAILKAGGAYLPLDPNYPKDRISFMVADTNISILLTQSNLVQELSGLKPRLVSLDLNNNDVAKQSGEDLKVSIEPNNVAYVIYTSGSTGLPKGVVITHSNISLYLQSLPKHLGITKQDVYLHTASFAFSSSVRQLLVPLCQGAKVVIASSEQIRDPLALFNLIKAQSVTVIDIVPSYWRSCIEALSSLDKATRTTLLNNNLRLVLSASEPLTIDIVKHWSELEHSAKLVNMYGQTETTGIVSVYPISLPLQTNTNIIPIGKPISNTQVYILDDNLQPVSTGVEGSIYIGGLGVGQCYLNQKEMTAERFITNPFSDKQGSYLYNTGDQGRYLADGNIEFLGRKDYQVKIRGFRIEPIEIEQVLRQHSTIKDIVVTVLENTLGNKRLIAYVVADKEQTPTAEELRVLAQKKLPEYMVPGVYMFLDSLPRTVSGKVDRQALPLPPALNNTTTETQELSLEQFISNVWAEALNVDNVSGDSDFFELGGDSMSAIQTISQLQEIFPTEVHLLAFFFESPTVSALVTAIESELGEETVQEILKTLNS